MVFLRNSQRFSEPVYRASSLCQDSACFGSDVDKVMPTAVYVFEHIVVFGNVWYFSCVKNIEMHFKIIVITTRTRRILIGSVAYIHLWQWLPENCTSVPNHVGSDICHKWCITKCTFCMIC